MRPFVFLCQFYLKLHIGLHLIECIGITQYKLIHIIYLVTAKNQAKYKPQRNQNQF